MLTLIKKMLGPRSPSEAEDPSERVRVAACALLLEMAHSDEEFHPVEQTLVRDLLQHRFDLSDAATAELIELAQGARQESLDLYHFAREINANFSMEEKLEMVESLWRIVYADGLLDAYEEYLMRQLTKLLRISHRQMIEAKLKILSEVRPRG